MLKQAIVAITLCLSLLIFEAHCNIPSNIPNDYEFPGKFHWNFGYSDPFLQSRASINPDSELASNEEREPLAPDYKDPVASATEEKPILQPKPTPFSPVIPDGIVDVDADTGFGNIPQIDPFIAGLPTDGGNEFDISGFNFNSKPGLFSFGGFFGSDARQWWKGTNVCVEREESSDDEDDSEKENKKNSTEEPSLPKFFSTSIKLSNCEESRTKYECVTKINNHGVVKTFTVRYRCCYGFQRQESSTGCTKQIDLKPLLDTLDDLKATQFEELIKQAGLEEQFTNENFTLFVPTDEALNDYNDKSQAENNIYEMAANRRRRAAIRSLPTRDLILSHAVKGFVDLTDLSNEEIIYSEHNNSSIRLNIYPTHTYERMVTVNCARVIKSNNLAKNGIVHLTDGVVLPASQTIRQIIESHPKLTNLRKVLENTDIYSHMKEDGHYTFFAASDDAFQKLDETEKQKILNGGGCAGSILKHHITAHTLCSSAIIGNATTHNVVGNVLNLERTEEDVLLFEGKARIIDTDIIATDGVIHLVDTIILPNSALYIGSVLKNENLTKFQELVEKAGLTEEINSLSNATVFAPENQVFERVETKRLLEEIGDDVEKLQDLVRYHTVQGQMQSRNMHNNAKLKSNDHGKELRVNLYSTLPLFSNIINRATVNCARLTGFDEKACGSVVHEVNRLLQPPTKSIYELIESDAKYSTLRQILNGTAVETILKDNSGSITFLAATDETFDSIDEDRKKELIEDKNVANEVLKNHILTEVLCCSGVGPHAYGFDSFVPTLANQHVQVARMGSKIRINRGVLTSCDNLATNGVLHSINKVLMAERHVPSFGGGFFLIDL